MLPESSPTARKGLEVVVDLGMAAMCEKLANRIVEHDFFKIEVGTGQAVVMTDILAKLFRCGYLSEEMAIAVGRDPDSEGEFYVVVAVLIDEENPGRRRLELHGSSDQLRQLYLQNKMLEYSQLIDKLRRKKDALALKLFDNL